MILLLNTIRFTHYKKLNDKKKKHINLGAVEVLEQNTTVDHANYLPTYKQLSSYDSFFGTAGIDFPAEKGGLDETLKKINEVINKYNYQAAAIAKHLKADTLEQSAFNLWHFCTTNISYKLDKLGFEQLRTPYRAWYDRFTGIDCDCFAIFTSCVLLQMGYKPQLAVVAFNYNGQFGHIYTVLNSKLITGPYNIGSHIGGAISGGVVIDPVMRTIFNKHPKGITKAKIMNIEVLNGIDDGGIVGFGAIMAADATTQKFIDYQEKLKVLKQAGQKVNEKEMRKLQFMILMNGHPERNHYLEIMDLVDDIDKYGAFVFISEDAETEAVKFLDATIGKGLTEYELSYENGKAIPVLRGLGADQLGELGSLKSAFKKVKEKVKATVKKVGEDIKTVATKVVKVIKKIDPIMLSMRGGLLLAISLNYRNITKRLYIAMMTPDELKKAGYTPAVQVALKPSLEHAKKIFKKLGGEEKNLISTIKRGWSKKPLFGKPDKGIQGIEEFEGLGVAPLIATALAAILAIVKSLTDSKAPLKPEDDDTTSPDAPENKVPGGATADFNKMMVALDPNSEPGPEPSYDSGTKDKTLWYVGGAALLLGILGLTMKSKK